LTGRSHNPSGQASGMNVHSGEPNLHGRRDA
jgi:hypothetical protein